MVTFGLYMTALLHVNPGPTGCWASALPLSCTPGPERHDPFPRVSYNSDCIGQAGLEPQKQPGSASKGQHDQKPDSSLRWTKSFHLSRFALTSQTQALRLTIICPSPPPMCCTLGLWNYGDACAARRVVLVQSRCYHSSAGVDQACFQFNIGRALCQALGLLKSRNADSMLPSGFQWRRPCGDGFRLALLSKHRRHVDDTLQKAAI